MRTSGADAPGWGRAHEDYSCAGCDHQRDEHTGAGGSCIANVVAFGLERFCLCREFAAVADL